MKKALVIVDMQRDFITGPLGNEECRAIVGNVVKKLEQARINGEDVIFTMDTHRPNYLETQEGENLPIPHCIKDTLGWLIIPELYVDDATVIYKNTFGSTHLGALCIEKNYDEIEFVGVCTDICVISNAMLVKAYCPETIITVDSSCCAGVTTESHQNALDAMKSCQIRIL